jgi:L-malate glycosyltransferase
MGLRILHLDSGSELRGGQRQLLFLARSQRERGHEPLIVAPPSSALLHTAQADGLAAAAVAMRGNLDLVAARRLRRLIRYWLPDLVHAHDARTHAIAIAALVGRRHVPLVVTRRLGIVPRRVRLKFGPRVSRFIAISGAVREAMVEGGVEPDRIDIVYSGVPAPDVIHRRDWRAELAWPAGSIVCGVLGMPADGSIDTLSAVVERLPREVRSVVRLLLLGGSAPCGPCDVGGITAFRTGHVDHVHPAIAGLDLLWHLGHPRSANGLGTAVIDAMSLGIPTLAYSGGALPEIIENGRNGIVVPVSDVDAFGHAATRLVTDRAFRSLLSAAGPTRARQFTIDRMVDGTEQVYRAVLDRA